MCYTYKMMHAWCHLPFITAFVNNLGFFFSTFEFSVLQFIIFLNSDSTIVFQTGSQSYSAFGFWHRSCYGCECLRETVTRLRNQWNIFPSTSESMESVTHTCEVKIEWIQGTRFFLFCLLLTFGFRVLVFIDISTKQKINEHLNINF